MAAVRPLGARHVWLSITPEPESELPRAIATLRSGGPPPAAAVERERPGRRHSCSAEAGVPGAATWPRRSRSPGAATTRPARRRALVEDVIRNHDNLELGLRVKQ